jgi:hypothetical protein
VVGAVKFRIERRVGDAEAVWRRLSRLEDMPKYWGGHRRVEVLGVSSGTYSLKITFAFPGPLNVGYAEATVDEARREVLLNYVKGPFRGVVKNYIADGVLVSDWDITINVGTSQSTPCSSPSSLGYLPTSAGEPNAPSKGSQARSAPRQAPPSLGCCEPPWRDHIRAPPAQMRDWGHLGAPSWRRPASAGFSVLKAPTSTKNQSKA